MDNSLTPDVLNILTQDIAPKKNEAAQLYGIFQKYGFKDTQVAFARLPDITNYFSKLKGSAASLYMFYVLHADNNTGESYWSVEKTAAQLGVTNKTVTTNNQLLINLGLIRRVGGSTTTSTRTYLLPTKSFIVTNESDLSLLLSDNSLLEYLPQKSLSFKLNTNQYMTYSFYKIKKEDTDSNIQVYVIYANLSNNPLSMGTIIDSNTGNYQQFTQITTVKTNSEHTKTVRDKINRLISFVENSHDIDTNR